MERRKAMISAQRDVIRGMLIGWSLSAAFIGAGYFFVAPPFRSGDPRALAVALALPALALAATIGLVAAGRYSGPHIDGSKPPPDSGLDLKLRFLTNTAEQTLLFALAALAFWFAAPSIAFRLLPVMSVWFCMARVLFCIGYTLRPSWRAPGFAATFHPVAVLLVAALIFAVPYA